MDGLWVEMLTWQIWTPAEQLYKNCGVTSKCCTKLEGTQDFVFTPPKFNMEPENDGFQKEFAFRWVDFQVPC